MTIEVIIPVKDRSEVCQCVQSLLPLKQISRIWLCDGGSLQPDCVAALQKLDQYERVHWLQFPMPGFNKSYLMNQGILRTTSEYLLISDADILWNSEAIQALLREVSAQNETICSIAEVQESDRTSASLRRDRYTYQITVGSDADWVEILPVNLSNSQVRPGCGLICTRRDILLKLGGYQECFQGWGWEDQDLLMRARLVGMLFQVAGSVVHLSHGDDQRNQHFHHIHPSKTRNCNILTCLNQLANGNLLGNLSLLSIPQIQHRTIQIQIPKSLGNQFEQQLQK